MEITWVCRLRYKTFPAAERDHMALHSASRYTMTSGRLRLLWNQRGPRDGESRPGAQHASDVMKGDEEEEPPGTSEETRGSLTAILK
ncbi:unnamed protein product [Lota lota]